MVGIRLLIILFFGYVPATLDIQELKSLDKNESDSQKDGEKK